jgi:hypothetical protein
VSNFASGDFETPYGTVTVRNPGRLTAPPNLRTYVQTNTRHVVLQGPALRAFKAAEERVATKSKPHILITGVGYRSYALQKALFESDENVGGRFADPDGSLHVEALAVDVDQGQGRFRLAKVNKALKAEGFLFAVSGEPWHASFHLPG